MKGRDFGLAAVAFPAPRLPAKRRRQATACWLISKALENGGALCDLDEKRCGDLLAEVLRIATAADLPIRAFISGGMVRVWINEP